MDIWIVIIPLLRVALYLTAFGAVGTLLFKLHFMRHLSSEVDAYCIRIIKSSGIIGAIIAVASLFSVAGNMNGNIFGIFDVVMLELAVESTAGHAALTSFAGFVLIYAWGGSATLLRGFTPVWGACLLLLSFVMTGHSIMNGLLTQALVVVHLIGLSYWIGALLPLRKLCNTPYEQSLIVIAHRFGIYAVGYVGALLMAGAVFAYILLGGFSPLITTAYGNVLLIKSIMVSMLLMFGAFNKFRLVSALRSDDRLGARRLYISIQYEIALVLVTLLLTSLMTTFLTPPVEMGR